MLLLGPGVFLVVGVEDEKRICLNSERKEAEKKRQEGREKLSLTPWLGDANKKMVFDGLLVKEHNEFHMDVGSLKKVLALVEE
jgi:hypothetical protein